MARTAARFLLARIALAVAVTAAVLTGVLLYDGPSKLYLFDLLRPAGSAEPAETITDLSPAVRCVHPASPLAFALR